MPQIDPSKLVKDLGTRVKAALDRADEIGGDVRDYLQDRWKHDPRLGRVRDQVARLRGKAPLSHGAAAAATAAAQAKAAQAAPAPTATPAAPAAATGLGNPALPAQVYGKKSCPWTGRAMTVLEKHKVDYDFIDLEESEHEALLPRLAAETNQHTVPFVYLRGQFVGGYNALAEIERLGQLEYALMTAEQRAAAPAHLRAIEIAARPNTDEVAPAETDDAAAD